MIAQTFFSRHPGKRIEDYRNSSPRYIKVLAVGPDAEDIVAEINDGARDNVMVSGRVEPAEGLSMDAPVGGIRPHAVIVVHQQGEADAFPFRVERTASMLSLIVLETAGIHDESADSRKVRDIRAIADLFVTTSDRGFVRELVDNLAS
ncbi:hypothetical protein HKCCE2091_06715 [Rhodobacterales bacterium HKCCE2091]|nr:hypothetical protein [Rhodobacterales bacterium HKCCE2091]